MEKRKSSSMISSQKKKGRSSRSIRTSTEKSSSISSTSIIKIGERHRCPRCKQESVELFCDDEIFFCLNCCWSFNIRILSHIVASEVVIRIMEGFKRMIENVRKAVETTGETFENFGKFVIEIDKKIQEEKRKKKEKEDLL